MPDEAYFYLYYNYNYSNLKVLVVGKTVNFKFNVNNLSLREKSPCIRSPKQIDSRRRVFSYNCHFHHILMPVFIGHYREISSTVYGVGYKLRTLVIVFKFEIIFASEKVCIDCAVN